MSDGSPPPLDALRRLTQEAADLQAVDAAHSGERFTNLRDSLVMAALYEIPALLARVDDLERERDGWKKAHHASEAEVARLTALTVAYKADQDCQRAEVQRATSEKRRADSLAAEVARLRTALSQVGSLLDDSNPHQSRNLHTAGAIARAALSGGAADGAAVGRVPAQEDKP